MKNKLILDTNGEVVSRICEFDKKTNYYNLKYTEQPNQKVEIKFYKDHCLVIKEGIINIKVNHQVGVTEVIPYEINMNGNLFSGESMIETKQYDNSDKVFYLEYQVDDQIIKQRWEIS